MAKKIETPQITPPIEEFSRYSKLNPEFDMPMTPRAEALLKSIFVDKTGNELPVKKIAQNIEIFRERIRAIVPQLEKSSRWQELLRRAHDQQQSPDHAGNLPLQVAPDFYQFKQSPPTVYRHIQEIFTEPTEYIIYSRDDADDKVWNLSDIVIDPSRISNAVLVSLGLEHYIPSKGLSKAEKIAARARAIPEIKEMMADLEPFTLSYDTQRSGLRYFRLMRIHSGKNRGYVLGTQRTHGKKVLFKTDLHGAHRRIDHIVRDNYSKEIGTLERIVSVIAEIDAKVATSWHELKGTAEMEEMSRELAGVVDELQFVQNEHKIKIKELIAACVSFKQRYVLEEKRGLNSRGETVIKRPRQEKEIYNPGAMRARWNTVKNFVVQREEEIQKIAPYLAGDQERIKTFIARQKAPFKRFYLSVERMHGEFKILDVSEPMSSKDSSKIAMNLLAIKAECSPEDNNGKPPKIVFEPYLAFAQQMAMHIDKTVSCLRSTPMKQKEAASEFIKIYLVSKIEYFFHELQKFYDEFLSGEFDPEKMPDFQKMEKAIERLGFLIFAKRVGAKIDGQMISTPEYDNIFACIYALLEDLKTHAQEHTRAEEPQKGQDETGAPAEIKKSRAQMKKSVKDFKFDALLRKIT